MRSPCGELRKVAPVGEGERGAVLALLAATLVLFMVVAALAVDLSALAARGQTLQNTADAAALAGVVEYQDQAILVGDEAARSAARARIEDIIRQNGIDPTEVLIDIEFPPDAPPSSIIVSIRDEDADSFLGGFAGFTPTVQRQATAEFVKCLDSCTHEVEIPRPFRSVSAQGRGDGYKPISVRNEGQNPRLYALNHNEPDQRIVCVDRTTQAPCWELNGVPLVERVAYANSVGFNDRNPEMPHTGVVGSKIYWSVSDGGGHRLFCWETLTDTPCSTAVQIGTDPRADEDDPGQQIIDDKDENRGGGTVVVDDKVYVFTDNHEVHCYDPAVGGYCGGYFKPYGGLDTALGDTHLGFPDNKPEQGNHGSSIDRIVDENTGRIYSTLHIENAPPGVACSSLADPDDQTVVIKNVVTGRFVTADELDDGDGDEIFPGTSGTSAAAFWDAQRRGSDGYTFESVSEEQYLDGDPSDEWRKEVSMSANRDDDDQWELTSYDSVTDSYVLVNFDTGGIMSDIDGDVYEDAVTLNESRWQILPWQCGDPGYTPPPPSYAPGTWLHCWDTGVVSGIPQPCPGFAASAIHANADRFSGRLFFYYGPDPDQEDPDNDIPKLGVCSTGYDRFFPDINNLDPDAIEISCVDIQTGLDSGLATSLDRLRDEIRQATGSRPGAWGDPHWNDFTNRLFYPTEHDTSYILCWDFDDGWCDREKGETPPNPVSTIETEDYGFFSERNCVFALGHNEYFWAFEAGDIHEDCKGAFSVEEINRCPCDGTFKWGELDFSDIDLTDFEVFDVRLYVPDTNPKQVVFPDPLSGRKWHSLLTDGTTIDLDAAGVSTEFEKLTIEVYVVAENDPFSVATTFTIRFNQHPRLTE